MLFRRAQATSLFHHIIRGRPSCVVSDPSVELFMIEGCLIVVATLVPRKNMSCPKQWWKFASKWLKPMRGKKRFFKFWFGSWFKNWGHFTLIKWCIFASDTKIDCPGKTLNICIIMSLWDQFRLLIRTQDSFLCLCQRLLVGTSLLPLKINYCLQFCAVECATRRRRAHFVAGNLRAGA